MNTSKISWLLLFLFLGCIALTGQDRPSGVTAIQGATIITATGSPTIRNGTIVIENGRIRAVGPRNEVQVPKGAQLIDARGKWIIPGLIDAHVRFSQSGGLYTRPDIID